jgi:hypothetical protein
MTLPVKLAKLGRSRRVTTFFEAQRQVDEIRAKVDDLIQALDNLDDNVNTPSGGSTIVVNSIAANGGTQRSGNITFTDTASVAVGNVANNFTFTAITPFAVPTIAYGTAYAAGVSGNTIRSDATLVYPEALATAAARTKTLTLTDVTGAILTTGAGVFGSDSIFFVPGGGSAVEFSTLGHIGAAGTPADAKYILTFQRSFNTSTESRGINSVVSQAGAGASATLGAGASSALRGIAVSASMTGTNALETCAVDAIYGTQNVNSTGDSGGYRAQLRITGNATRSAAWAFKSQPVSGLTNGTLTDVKHFWAVNQTNIVTTLTNQYGTYIESFGKGTNRWSHWGSNKFHCDASDVITNTAGKGHICKDAQGTPEFWRMFASVSGTTVKDATWTTDADGFASFTRAASATGSVILNVQDVGTAAPLT